MKRQGQGRGAVTLPAEIVRKRHGQVQRTGGVVTLTSGSSWSGQPDFPLACPAYRKRNSSERKVDS